VNEARLDIERLARVQEERERIREAFPAEFKDGAQRGFLKNPLYPSRFLDWPLGRRNAWFAGFNVGYCDRERFRKERERGDG
jgi:hypothetical protein